MEKSERATKNKIFRQSAHVRRKTSSTTGADQSDRRQTALEKHDRRRCRGHDTLEKNYWLLEQSTYRPNSATAHQATDQTLSDVYCSLFVSDRDNETMKIRISGDSPCQLL